MAAKTPKRIGRYKILGELGRGAMGVVYKAEDPALDRVVALKTISLAAADGRQDYEKRFMLEAKAAGKLTHPNIVTIFDYGEEEDLAYMAMELLEGSDLRSRMRREQIPPMEAVEIALQVADGLGFALEQHDVAGLDVAVDDAVLVRERQALGDLQRDVHRLRRGHRALAHARAQLGALQQLHRHVGEVVLLAEIEDGDDVGVRELAGGLRLQHEALLVVLAPFRLGE